MRVSEQEREHSVRAGVEKGWRKVPEREGERSFRAGEETLCLGESTGSKFWG